MIVAYLLLAFTAGILVGCLLTAFAIGEGDTRRDTRRGGYIELTKPPPRGPQPPPPVKEYWGG